MKKESPLVPVIGLLVAQLCVGILYIWSVLKPAAVSYYGWDDGAGNLVASFMLFAFCVGNFIGGALNDRIGPKKVCIAGMLLFGGGIFLSSFIPAGKSVLLFYATYCLIGGLGSGMTYGAVISGILKWFPHRRGFATGLGASVFGFATVVFGPLTSKLLAVVSFSTTLQILSVAFLVIGVLASIFVRLPSQEYLSALPAPVVKNIGKKVADVPFRRAVREFPFWGIALGIFFYNGTWNLITPLIKELGVDRGLSEAVAVTCVSLTGITNASGRLIMATVSDRFGRENTILLLSGVTAVGALLLIFAGSYAYFFVILLLAFTYGSNAGINPAASADFFGAKYSGTNYGVQMLALGISSIVFNALSNALYAATGEYTLTFLMGAVTAAATIVVYIFIKRCAKQRSL